MSEPQVTVTFTVRPYVAALLIAAYDIFSQPSGLDGDLDLVAPQTLDNYATLCNELHDAGHKLIGPAEEYSEDVANQIKRVLGKPTS